MAETWEDCVALLRAGASPSEVLPKLRELMNSELLPQSAQAEVPRSSENSQSSSICFYRVNDVLLQLPYAQPPPTLWQELSNYSDEHFFDSETVIDLLQEFSPIFVGPPEEEIREMLHDLALTSPSNERCDGSENSSKEGETDDQNERVATVLQNLLLGQKDIDDGEEYIIPMLSEAEWTWALNNVNFDRAGKDTVSRLVGYVNQRSFSRVILHSIVPVLADEIEREDFLELVSTIASSAEVYSMPHNELLDLMNVYRGIESKGALAQLEILCCGEVQ
ncbi:hypothetical protein FGB62_16g255 [Gracilaria domingensis]|nr:hypothetical protein FGB62_16g255 [Gracilaria domingensis]